MIGGGASQTPNNLDYLSEAESLRMIVILNLGQCERSGNLRNVGGFCRNEFLPTLRGQCGDYMPDAASACPPFINCIVK
jgi:hypothetical protein